MRDQADENNEDAAEVIPLDAYRLPTTPQPWRPEERCHHDVPSAERVTCSLCFAESRR